MTPRGGLAWVKDRQLVRSHVRVRRAHPSESQALSDLALRAKALGGYSQAQLASWASELFISPESIAAEPTFVAEADRGLVGVVQLATHASPWEIEHLWVHPSAMRQGVGSRLVQQALRYAHRQGQRELRVDADPLAEQFYVRLGARRIGEVAAPIEGEPSRVRPQLVVSTAHAAPPSA